MQLKLPASQRSQVLGDQRRHSPRPRSAASRTTPSGSRQTSVASSFQPSTAREDDRPAQSTTVEQSLDGPKEPITVAPNLDGRMQATPDSILAALSKSDIQEMKSFTKPPSGVIQVCQALCLCFGVPPKKVPTPEGLKRDDYLAPCQKDLLGNAGFLSKLANFDKDNIPAGVMNKLLSLEADPSFDPDKIKKVSAVASNLCRWVRAIIAYDRSAKASQAESKRYTTAEDRPPSPTTQSTVSRDTTGASEALAASDAPTLTEEGAPVRIVPPEGASAAVTAAAVPAALAAPAAPAAKGAMPSKLRRPKSPDEHRKGLPNLEQPTRRAASSGAKPRAAADAAERRRAAR